MSPACELGDDEVADMVRTGYDAISASYTSLASTTGNAASHPRHTWTEALLARLESGSRVLDLGCGGGLPTGASIVAAGHQVVGVDLSEAQIVFARAAVPEGTFIRGDMLEMELEPDSFDAVVALYSIIHVPRGRYLELPTRLRGALRPGGWLLASFATIDSPGWLEDTLLGLGARNRTNSYDPITTERLIQEAGFAPDRFEVVAQNEPTGPENWLFVRAQPATS